MAIQQLLTGAITDIAKAISVPVEHQKKLEEEAVKRAEKIREQNKKKMERVRSFRGKYDKVIQVQIGGEKINLPKGSNFYNEALKQGAKPIRIRKQGV